MAGMIDLIPEVTGGRIGRSCLRDVALQWIDLPLIRADDHVRHKPAEIVFHGEAADGEHLGNIRIGFVLHSNAKELEQYPEIMNKEQLRKVCHISKRTAHYLLQFNLIPHVCTGKKTRCYAIKKRDVIDFMINREVNPNRYIVPTGWYKYGNEDVKPYKIRIQPPIPNDPQKTRRYYESKLASYPDVIDVAAVVEFTGYSRHTVCEWIRFGKLRALALQHKYMIPKCYLIDWLSSDEHNATLRKSRRHIDRLWELQKWSDGQ